MTEIVLYVIASAIVVGIGISVAVKLIPRYKLVGCALAIAIPFLPYVKVELLTRLYRQNLLPSVKQALHQDGDSQSIRFLKVLNCSKTKATVYVVVNCLSVDNQTGYVGFEIPLVKRGNSWVSSSNPAYSMDAVWSDCGSAEGNVFPPYPGKYDFSN